MSSLPEASNVHQTPFSAYPENNSHSHRPASSSPLGDLLIEQDSMPAYLDDSAADASATGSSSTTSASPWSQEPTTREENDEPESAFFDPPRVRERMLRNRERLSSINSTASDATASQIPRPAAPAPSDLPLPRRRRHGRTPTVVHSVESVGDENTHPRGAVEPEFLRPEDDRRHFANSQEFTQLQGEQQRRSAWRLQYPQPPLAGRLQHPQRSEPNREPAPNFSDPIDPESEDFNTDHAGTNNPDPDFDEFVARLARENLDRIRHLRNNRPRRRCNLRHSGSSDSNTDSVASFPAHQSRWPASPTSEEVSQDVIESQEAEIRAIQSRKRARAATRNATEATEERDRRRRMNAILKRFGPHDRNTDALTSFPPYEADTTRHMRGREAQQGQDSCVLSPLIAHIMDNADWRRMMVTFAFFLYAGLTENQLDSWFFAFLGLNHLWA